ncbi:MAG: hypothetical protein ACE5I9_06670 [Candidatus Methylomirabilales bacterium]
MAAPKPRHYIIVVHGMGEQKQNATAPEVVHRFAEVRWKDRHPDEKARQYQNLLPANLSGQSIRRRGTGHGWSEFNGIPIGPHDPTGDFDGTPATDTSGRNFRFVDLHWQHILQRHLELYASPAEKWAPALLERIDEKKGIAPEEWIPKWATEMLRSLVDTALPLKTLLSFRYRDLAKLIFDDILGDVHLYGDYARTRGRAVRHFHVILDEIHLRDFIDWCRNVTDVAEYHPPVYTVIAHSLGSIMSFDALVYAHASRTIREDTVRPRHPCPSLPFPGYTEAAEGEKETWDRLIQRLDSTGRKNELKSRYPQLTDDHPRIPPLMWRGHVKNFVTLGSPIDKFHVIWFQNYLHMGLRKKYDKKPGGYQEFRGFKKQWAENWLEVGNEIVHYNLCDEQDPVGHHLDVAQASENYKKIFNTSIPVAYRDVVFRRYAVPGLAHVKYWEDKDLFTGIIKEVIDGEKGAKQSESELTEYEKQEGLKGSYFLRRKFWNRKGVYEKTLQWAYFRVPFLASLVTGGLLSYGLLGWAQSGFGISYLAAILAAILLWTRPRPTEEYAQEARPEQAQLETEGAALKQRWKFRRSILAHLVAGMVEWRRILLLLSVGDSTDRETCLKNKMRLALKRGKERTGRYWKKARKRYIVATAVLVFSAFLACPYFIKVAGDIVPNIVRNLGSHLGIRQKINNAGWIGIILSLSYLGTMIYARHLYKKAIERGEEKAA